MITYQGFSLLALSLALTVAACGSSSSHSDSAAGDASSEAQGGHPILRPSSPSIVLYAPCIGDTSPPGTIQIFNDGDAVANIEVTPPDEDLTIISLEGCASVAPGAACTITVVYRRTKLGAQSVGLQVTAPGFGKTMIIGITIGGTRPAPFQFSPTYSKFDPISVGMTSPTETFKVEVAGVPACSPDAGPMSFSLVLSSDEFVIKDDGCSMHVIPIGGVCTFGVAFRPTSPGAKDAILSVGWPSYSRSIGLSGMALANIDAGIDAEPSEPMDSGRESEAGNPSVDGGSG
jgi:hypothetical protein